nr:MAG: DNA pilot protein [Microvirus sp.]
MNPLTGGIIAGGMNLLGSMFSNSTSASNTQAQIQAQQQMQQQTMAWNEKMSNTAYQRASTDMQAAGLNPAMMFSSGSAASSPQMSPQQIPVAQNRGALAGIGEATERAISSAVQVKTMDKMSDEMANLVTQNSHLNELVKQVQASTATERERKSQVQATTANIEQDTTRAKLDRARQEWEAIKHLDLSSIPDAVRKSGNIGAWAGGKIGDAIAPVTNSARSVLSLLPRVSKSQRSHVNSDGKSFDEFWENRTGYGVR